MRKKTVAEFEQILKDRRTPGQIADDQDREQRYVDRKMPSLGEFWLMLYCAILFGLYQLYRGIAWLWQNY